jgi:hypothetical protein
VLDARRGLCVHHSDHPCVPVPVERLENRVIRYALAPVGVDRHDARVMTPRDFGDPAAEKPTLGDDDLVAELEQVCDPALHAGRAAAVEGQHEAVGHPVDAPQHGDDVEQDVVKVGVEVAEHRLAHRVEHGRVYVRGSWAAQKSLGRPELGEIHHVRVPEAHREHKLRVLRNT